MYSRYAPTSTSLRYSSTDGRRVGADSQAAAAWQLGCCGGQGAFAGRDLLSILKTKARIITHCCCCPSCCHSLTVKLRRPPFRQAVAF